MATRDKRRPHGPEAAGAGDLGSIDHGKLLGPCPGCEAELRMARVPNPQHGGRLEEGLIHPVPFCTYFGATDSAQIVHDMIRKRQEAEQCDSTN